MERKQVKYGRVNRRLAVCSLAAAPVCSSGIQLFLTFALMTAMLFKLIAGPMFCPNMQPTGAGDGFANIICSSTGIVANNINPSGDKAPQSCDWCSCCPTTVKFLLLFIVFGIIRFGYTAFVYRNWQLVFTRLLVVLAPYAPRPPPAVEPATFVQ